MSGARVRVKFTEEPDRVAVTMAELVAVTVEAVAEKLAEVEPAATVTEAGTESRVLLSESVTRAPPVGAARLSVTVQVLEVLEVRVVGVQVSAVGSVGAMRPTEAFSELPGSVAVPLAVLSAVIVKAVAVKAAEEVPAVTVTEVGTVNNALFLDRATEVPPAGAGLCEY